MEANPESSSLVRPERETWLCPAMLVADNRPLARTFTTIFVDPQPCHSKIEREGKPGPLG